MDKTLDYKLGQIDTKIENLTTLHGEDKDIRDENHKKIGEISDAVIELKNGILKLDSWKNGQTEYMHLTTENIMKIDKKFEVYKDTTNERLRVLEVDYNTRADNRKSWKDRTKDTLWGGAKWAMGILLLVIIYVLLTHGYDFYQTLINILPH